MAIKVYLEDILKERGMTSKELCQKIGITEANLSILRSGKAKGISVDSGRETLSIRPARVHLYLERHRSDGDDPIDGLQRGSGTKCDDLPRLLRLGADPLLFSRFRRGAL